MWRSHVLPRLVDLSLRGRSTLPLADEMARIGIPLIFVSGLDPAAVADRFPDAQFIGKPFDSGAVIEAIAKAFAARRSRGI